MFDRMLRSDIVLYREKKIRKELIAYFFSKITRTIPTPMVTMGLDNKPVAVDATDPTVFPATFATEPIVLPATFATAPIDDVTLPTNCPGIEIIPVAIFPTVPMI